MGNNGKVRLSLLEVTSLGVGTMIGAGIFALFGQISTLAGGFAWAAFLVSGIVSALAGYAYYDLSKISNTNGGVAEYLTRGWNGSLVGSTIAFCYFLSIAIVLGLVAESFGHYTAKVLSMGTGLVDYFAIGVMLCFLVINAAGIKLMGVAEKVLVIAKLVVLVGFTALAFSQFDSATYAANDSSVSFGFGNFVNAVALANLSFAGFAVIANAGGSVQSNATIARAIFIAILLVGAVYVALDVAVFGSIDLSTIESAKDYALAAAAKPVLGTAGFLIIGITAMVSTMTNINANIFSGSNTVGFMARHNQVSQVLAKPLFLRQGNIAMLATVGIVILMIVTLDLSQIGDVASATFLLVHTFIPLGALLYVKRKGGLRSFLLGLATLANGALLLFFLWHLKGQDMTEIYVFAGVIAFAVLFTGISRAVLGVPEIEPVASQK
ncbi:APC family permease [Qipengyuania gelatinilytica]|uniref:APC family permease n=1 Tax=Qipengyuania gelatinilytica TaxID=2867231 RepID=A0ABX9A4E8_9SPHN|nr:APC family permease [Qipengyuania gelatinilytica]QZD96146.1 APC family permease [Qipengyuania gelatinilytica]